jgi:hypothetical protein
LDVRETGGELFTIYPSALYISAIREALFKVNLYLSVFISNFELRNDYDWASYTYPASKNAEAP